MPVCTVANACLALVVFASLPAEAGAGEPLAIAWEKNYLTISGEALPGPVRIHYLEAYCRPGSTDREWGQTVIPHTAQLVAVEQAGRVIRLRDKLADGVVVDHTITAGADEVDFRVVAHNPTDKASEAHWAQPCIRVDQFLGIACDTPRAVVPAYARKCFLFIDDRLTRLPTEPWATKARYTPGQVYCPQDVDRNDVNPRPLSKLVPSNGLTGCFSADEKMMMAVAWSPYQEIFQGVICCMHSDFRIGGLQPGETKTIIGKMYFVPADVEKLVERYERDFPGEKPE